MKWPVGPMVRRLTTIILLEVGVNQEILGSSPRLVILFLFYLPRFLRLTPSLLIPPTLTNTDGLFYDMNQTQQNQIDAHIFIADVSSLEKMGSHTGHTVGGHETYEIKNKIACKCACM